MPLSLRDDQNPALAGVRRRLAATTPTTLAPSLEYAAGAFVPSQLKSPLRDDQTPTRSAFSIAMPPTPTAPTTPPDRPDDRYADSPRELHAGAGPSTLDVRRVALGALPTSQATPTMPSSPSPVAARPPAPYVPPEPMGAAPIASRTLFGRANGLLEGGLGVPGAMSDQGPTAAQVAALLEMMRYLGR